MQRQAQVPDLPSAHSAGTRGAHLLTSDDAERLTVHCLRSSNALLEQPRDHDLILGRTAVSLLEKPLAHRPASKALLAMGLISLVMSRKPSYGLSSRGFTIVAVTVAMTLSLSAKSHESASSRSLPHAALDGAELGAEAELERTLLEWQPAVKSLSLLQRLHQELPLYCRRLDFSRHVVG